MFVGAFGTVRWETSVKGPKALTLTVKGPRDAETSREFSDPLALVEFQSDAERRLMNSGYDVSADAERRSGVERRVKKRASRERRRP
jgi:hypothetical protein